MSILNFFKKVPKQPLGTPKTPGAALSKKVELDTSTNEKLAPPIQKTSVGYSRGSMKVNAAATCHAACVPPGSAPASGAYGGCALATHEPPFAPTATV